MKPVFVESPGFAAPGLAGWAQAQAVLRGEQVYAPQALEPYQPALLPANERRRATPAVRLAFRVAEEAVHNADAAPRDLASVFATAEADTTILHRICSALAQESRAVSPTDFHNSVHNAAAGYWSIATKATRPSVTLAAYDATFITGLIEACGLVHGEGCKVLLAVYDLQPPEPLWQSRPLRCDAGVALVLSGSAGERTLGQIAISADTHAETTMDSADLEALRLGNPACRALPLLARLAQRRSGAIHFAGAGEQGWQLALHCP